MHQILFNLPQWLPMVGGMPVYGYGVMLVIGFFAGMQLAMFLARRSGINPELFVNAGLIALITGVIGARLSHVLENLHDYTRSDLSFWQNVVNAINIRSGGLTFYGGFLLGTLCTIAYGLTKKVSIRTGMDIAAPCLMIGLGFGRIGCFLNGCCYGAECEKQQVPWAMHFPYYSNPYIEEVEKGRLRPPDDLLKNVNGAVVPKPPQEVQAELSEITDPILKARVEAEKDSQTSNWLHPSQLYSTITAWLIAALLVACYTVPHVPGRIFALMVIIESPTRYILEMLRAELPVVGQGSSHLQFLPPQSFSMVLSVILFVVGIALWFAFRGPKVVPGVDEYRAQGLILAA